MKNLNCSVVLATMMILGQGCGLRPDLAQAPKSLNPQNNATAAAFSAPTGAISEDVRAATILVYPEPEDVADFSMDPTAAASGTSADWNILLGELPYRNSMLTTFSSDQDPFIKAKEMAKLILASGQARDTVFRQAADLTKQEDRAREVLAQNETDRGVTATSFNPYNCFYDRNNYSSSEDIYRCKLVKEGEFKIKKMARNCLQFSRFQFVEALDEAGVQLQQLCNELIAEVVRLKDQGLHKRRVRVAGENVVLDLLLEMEKANKRVFVATASTTEKPDSNGGSASQIKFNREFTEVESMKLFIEFLGPYASVRSRQEYSWCNDGTCNGKISKPIVTFKQLRDRTYPQVTFTLTLPDMEIDIKADLSYEAGVMGLRMVDSKTFVRYNDGTNRRGVFKLEVEVL